MISSVDLEVKFLVSETGLEKTRLKTLDIPCIGVVLQTNDGGVHKLD